MEKLNKALFILISIMILSCINKKDNIEKNQTVDNYSKIDFSGHTLFKVIETDSGRVLYKPCGANIEKFKIYRDSIFHNLGQEYYTLNISSKEVLENEITYRLIYKYNLEKPENSDSILKIQPLDKKQKFWKINNDLYIDSVFVSTIKTIKELPCDEECYDCPQEKDLAKNEKTVTNWKVNCEDGNASMQIDDNNVSLEIMYNQIYIDMVEVEQNKFEKSITYKLKEKPEDLGGFGIKLDWKSFINDKPIACLKFINDKTIHFYWYGFYNDKTKKREFIECEFQQESIEKYGDKHVVLMRCDL